MRRWINLSIVVAIMFVAGLLLALDYNSTADKLLALLSAIILCVVGVRLYVVFNRKHLLPE